MTDFEKKDAKNQEEVTLDYHDILQIASGIDEDGNPNASAILAIDEIESAVQIVAMANDSHGMSGILRRAAAAHVVADLGRLEKTDQILNQLG